MTAFLHEYVAGQAERRPDSVAVVMGDAAMTYREIEEESGRIANLLSELGCRRGDRVCLLMEKSPRAIASAIGTLKAGCSYVPLDVNGPVLRAEKIVRATEPKVIVADERALALVQELAALGACSTETSIVSTSAAPGDARDLVTATASDWMKLDSTFAPLSRSSDDPAHILFTSGSTGMPKGVVVTHANVAAFIEWAVGYFGTRPTDRISGHPPLHFDLSTFDIYGTLRAGAELHLVPPEKNLLPSALVAFIRGSRLHQWFAVPSVFTMIAASDALGEHDFPSLERVLWCGEVLPASVLRYWMERLPHATFTNLYGPTETTIASSFHTVTRPPLDDEPIPIGRACDGEALYVLDERLTPAAPGEVGEIYIGGVGVSPGYWRDAELTRRAFLPDPFGDEASACLYRTGDLGRSDDNGVVYFVGRADSQIKHRGHRIELGEVEIAVNALAAVGEAVVIATPTEGFEGNRICCAYVPAQGVDDGARVLRRLLRRTLPEYMLPTTWLPLAALPKNANGKVDRARIRELFAGTSAEQGASATSHLERTATVPT